MLGTWWLFNTLNDYQNSNLRRLLYLGYFFYEAFRFLDKSLTCEIDHYHAILELGGNVKPIQFNVICSQIKQLTYKVKFLMYCTWLVRG
jgi:hypothetical protein